jgi:hypothetical protein
MILMFSADRGVTGYNNCKDVFDKSADVGRWAICVLVDFCFVYFVVH